MDQSSRSFRKVAACVVVLSCLGGAAWLLLPEEGGLPVEAVKSAVRNVTKQEPLAPEKTQDSVSSTVQEGGEKSGRIRQVQSAQEFSSALSSAPPPVKADPRDELLARVEKAMEEGGSSVPGGHAVSGPVQDIPPAVEERRQDSVVTGAFVRDMGRWLAASYTPSRREGRPGRTSVTLERGNFRYSNSSTLRSVERDPMKSRSVILNYVFTPGMLEALYRMYAPRLVEEMELAAREERGGRTLSDAQVADMFQVYAGTFRRLSASLSAAAEADVPALSAAIRRAEDREKQANDAFARAYTALARAREAGNREEVAELGRRMEESTRTAGVHAERQERARADMVYAIRRRAGSAVLSDAELVFLGEWLSRHNCSDEATRTAADICRRAADLFESRAAVLTGQKAAPATAGTPQNVSAADAARPSQTQSSSDMTQSGAPAAAETPKSSQAPVSSGPVQTESAADAKADASAAPASPVVQTAPSSVESPAPAQETPSSSAPAQKTAEAPASLKKPAAVSVGHEVSGSLSAPASQTASQEASGVSEPQLSPVSEAPGTSEPQAALQDAPGASMPQAPAQEAPGVSASTPSSGETSSQESSTTPPSPASAGEQAPSSGQEVAPEEAMTTQNASAADAARPSQTQSSSDMTQSGAPAAAEKPKSSQAPVSSGPVQTDPSAEAKADASAAPASPAVQTAPSSTKSPAPAQETPSSSAPVQKTAEAPASLKKPAAVSVGHEVSGSLSAPASQTASQEAPAASESQAALQDAPGASGPHAPAQDAPGASASTPSSGAVSSQETSAASVQQPS